MDLHGLLQGQLYLFNAFYWTEEKTRTGIPTLPLSVMRAVFLPLGKGVGILRRSQYLKPYSIEW
jgi:hypothetical protein